jgi:hypothetical protein
VARDDFGSRITELQRIVGRGHLVGVVGFGQDLPNYAIPQHQGYWENFMGHFGFKEMHQPLKGYLSKPLQAAESAIWQGVAMSLLTTGPVVTMSAAMEGLQGAAQAMAPFRTGALKGSAYHRVGAD